MTSFLPREIRPAAPPLKTQGIKTRLTPFIARAVAWSGEGRWIEPFLGSGAVLLNIAPPRALVADSNAHVIGFYRALQHGTLTPAAAVSHLEREGALLRARGEAHYYAVRERFNADHDPLDLLFLNRACFNGVMRFNRAGAFNVPFCRKPERFRPALVTKIRNQLERAARLLRERDWELRCQDWRDTLAAARRGDFVYLDPPYIGRHAGYFNAWDDADADALARAAKTLPCGFAYSMWKRNRFRANAHLAEHFAEFPLRTIEHFYHVGAAQSLRHGMEEALVVAPAHAAAMEDLPCDEPVALPA